MPPEPSEEAGQSWCMTSRPGRSRAHGRYSGTQTQITVTTLTITLCNKEATAMDIIKVSARSRSTAVAGAIAGVIRESGRAEVQAIGAGAVNQATKAVAIARGYLALDGIDVISLPSLTEVDIAPQERTALRLLVEPRVVPPTPPA
jgi:stage V sporulation protein S